MLAPEVEAQPWANQLALDDARYRAQLAYLFERSAFYREKLAADGFASGGGGRRARGHRGAAAHRQARDQGDLHTREPDRGSSLRAGVRDSAHLLDERNDRRSQLRPADGARPRQLGDRLGAELRGIRRRRGPAHRVHIRRRAVRRRRGACRVRAHRTLPRSGRNPEHRASDPRGRAAQAEAVVLMPSSSIQGRDPLWRWMTARLGSSC
jgi:hypothetical protein